MGKDLAAQATAARVCRAGGLVLPAKRRSPPKTCSVEHSKRGGRELHSPYITTRDICVCLCVSLCQDTVSQTLVLRGKVILRTAKAYFGFRSLYICHSSWMQQLCTFAKKLSLTQNISQPWGAEWIHRLRVPEQSQAELGRLELEAKSRLSQPPSHVQIG